MDISSISGSFAPLPPASVHRTTEDPNLSAIRLGNEDVERVNPSEFGGPESDKNILQQLTVTRQDSETSSTRLMDKLRTLQALKKSDDPNDRMDAIKEFGRLVTYKNEEAKSIGTAGLLSAIYINFNSDQIHSVSSMLMLLLDPKLTLGAIDFERISNSVLTAFVKNKANMNLQTIQDIMQSIDKLQLRKFEHLTSLIDEFIKTPAAALQNASDPLNAGAKGKMTISQLVAAENIKNIPGAIALQRTEPTVTRPNIDGLLATLNTLRMMFIYSLWPSLLRSPQLIFLVMLLDRIGQNLVTQKRKMRRLVAALVTHPSATIPDPFLQKMPVYVVDYDPENYIRIFHDKFLSLQNSGFTTVFALLPHSDFWHSYHHARHALTRPTASIIVIDTKLYGLALGILVREVAVRMAKLQRRDEIDGIIRKMLPLIHYWIVPSQTKTVNGHFWYQKMKRQSPFKDQMQGANQLPIIGFGETAGIVGTASNMTQGLLKLEAMVVELYHRNNQSPRIIIIEHHNMHPVAVSLENYFQRAFPTTKVSIQLTTRFLGNEIGEFIGVLSV